MGICGNTRGLAWLRCSWRRHSPPASPLRKPAKTARTKNQKDSADPRPKVILRATPVIAMAPARVVFMAELTGGANDFEEFYCGAVEWEWGDGTQVGIVERLRAVPTGKIRDQATVHRRTRLQSGRLPRHVSPQATRQGRRQRDDQHPGAARPARRHVTTRRHPQPADPYADGRIPHPDTTTCDRFGAGVFPGESSPRACPDLARRSPTELACPFAHG